MPWLSCSQVLDLVVLATQGAVIDLLGLGKRQIWNISKSHSTYAKRSLSSVVKMGMSWRVRQGNWIKRNTTLSSR